MSSLDPDFDTENPTGQYILDEDGEPVPEPDLLKWGAWYREADRHVAVTIVGGDGDHQVRVSTVFVGMDHNFGGVNSTPILWETMIFGGPNSDYMRRYTTRADALAGHEEAARTALIPEGDGDG